MECFRLANIQADRERKKMENQNNDRRPFTFETAAAYLGCSSRHVRRMVKAGKLRHFYFGNLLRIPADAIDELQPGSHAPAPGPEPAPKQPSHQLSRLHLEPVRYLGSVIKPIQSLVTIPPSNSAPTHHDWIHEVDAQLVLDRWAAEFSATGELPRLAEIRRLQTTPDNPNVSCFLYRRLMVLDQ